MNPIIYLSEAAINLKYVEEITIEIDKFEPIYNLCIQYTSGRLSFFEYNTKQEALKKLEFLKSKMTEYYDTKLPIVAQEIS